MIHILPRAVSTASFSARFRLRYTIHFSREFSDAPTAWLNEHIDDSLVESYAFNMHTTSVLLHIKNAPKFIDTASTSKGLFGCV